MENKEVTEDSTLLEALELQGDIKKLTEMLEEMPTAKAIDFLSTKETEDILKYLSPLKLEEKGRIFSELDLDTNIDIFRTLEKQKFASIYKHISSDVRADIYKELSLDEQNEFLPFLDKKIREDVIVLSSYPSETAGGIMTTDFATILIEMSAQEALAKLRSDAPSKKMIYYLYVVNESMKMQGILTLKDLLFCDPKAKIKDIISEFVIYAELSEDQESVAKKIEKYDLVAIPVLNTYQQLVGIVHHDDAMDVLRAEQTEDMEKFMGIVPTEDNLSYMETTTFYHFKKRVFWIIGLAAIGLISGIIVHKFEDTLSSLMILALYMPMMAATGGNSGSQAATVVIRAMALGEIKDSNWVRIILKETKISILLSVCVALLVFLNIAFLSDHVQIPDSLSYFAIGFYISLAIALQVITSAMIGTALPLLVKRLGGDPAVAASPAITTFVDITGLLIYFGIVSYALAI